MDPEVPQAPDDVERVPLDERASAYLAACAALQERLGIGSR